MFFRSFQNVFFYRYLLLQHLQFQELENKTFIRESQKEICKLPDQHYVKTKSHCVILFLFNLQKMCRSAIVINYIMNSVMVSSVSILVVQCIQNYYKYVISVLARI